MKTPTQLEECVAGLRDAIKQSRAPLDSVRNNLAMAFSKATYASLPSGLRSGITEIEEDDSDDAAVAVLKAQTARFKAELEVLRQYADVTLGIWDASAQVDLSQGLTPEAKSALLAIFTAALS